MADRVLRFTDLPQRPTATQLDEIMRQVSEQLDEKWTGVRLGSYWMLYKEHDDGSGWKDRYQSRRQFISALSDATEASIVNAISL